MFTVEFVIKVVALGLFKSRNSYMRDGWNNLDMIVVLAAYMQLIPSFPKMSLLRSFRLLRPLKAISKLKGVKVLVSSILRALPAVVAVSGFLAFFLMLFAISGQSFWESAYNKRCRTTELPMFGEWSIDPLQITLCGNQICTKGTYCPTNDQMTRDPLGSNAN